jgi:hypothetical protein
MFLITRSPKSPVEGEARARAEDRPASAGGVEGERESGAMLSRSRKTVSFS